MALTAIAAFVALAAFAAYVQTVTGFAFGLMMMGAIGLSGLMPLTDAAVIVSGLTIVNAVQMMAKGWRDVARRELALTLAASLPAVVAGYLLLGWLAANAGDLLKLVLGLVIMASSLQLALKPRPLPLTSSGATFIGFGAISGLMSGLFSTGGPPLVYHIYRQPWPLATIRETIVASFGTGAILRMGLVIGTGALPPPSTLATLIAIPAVMAFTQIGRRYPPPFSLPTMRRIAFVLLFLSGLSLALPAALGLVR